jgi:hypothetical protein
LGRDCQFVPTFPAHFYFTGRRHPTPVGALARDAGEFARAATKRPGTLKRGLAASGGYFALVQADKKLRLWGLIAKGYTDIEIDYRAAKRD